MTDPQETLCATCEEPADARCPIDRHPLHEALPSECRHHPFAPSSAPPSVPAVEEARAEAKRRYSDQDFMVGAAFIAGAEWAREAEGEVERLRATVRQLQRYSTRCIRRCGWCAWCIAEGALAESESINA